MALPGSNQNMQAILDKARADRADRDARLPQRQLAEGIDRALTDAFPHIRHDEQFQAAAREYIKTLHETTEDKVPLQCLASSLHMALEHSLTRPNHDEPGNDGFAQLLDLYPVYKTMAAEIDRDYGSIGVRLNMRKPKSQQHGDHWRERAQELRASAATNVIGG